MIADIGNCNWNKLLRDQAREALVERHAQGPDSTRMQAKRRGQHEVRAVRLQQIGGADIRMETRSDQRHDVHQGVCRLAALFGEARNFFPGQDSTGFGCFVELSHTHSLTLQSNSESVLRNCSRPCRDTEVQPVRRPVWHSVEVAFLRNSERYYNHVPFLALCKVSSTPVTKTRDRKSTR